MGPVAWTARRHRWSGPGSWSSQRWRLWGRAKGPTLKPPKKLTGGMGWLLVVIHGYIYKYHQVSRHNWSIACIPSLFSQLQNQKLRWFWEVRVTWRWRLVVGGQKTWANLSNINGYWWLWWDDCGWIMDELWMNYGWLIMDDYEWLIRAGNGGMGWLWKSLRIGSFPHSLRSARVRKSLAGFRRCSTSAEIMRAAHVKSWVKSSFLSKGSVSGPCEAWRV